MNRLLKNKTNLFICKKRNNQIWKLFAENSLFAETKLSLGFSIDRDLSVSNVLDEEDRGRICSL